MLNRDTDLTSNRLFHKPNGIINQSDVINYLKRNLFGYYDVVNLGNFVIEDRSFDFDIMLAKIGIFTNEHMEYVVKSISQRYCDKCGREFSVAGFIDKHYCIPSDESPSLCSDCNRELSNSFHNKEIISKIFKISIDL